jgi:type II secretory pathway pseudopilin PulG
MNPKNRLSGITILEILAGVAIALCLGALIFPVLQSLQPKAEAVRCMNNLRNLRIAFSDYATTGWPQLPPSVTMGSLEEQNWWLEKTKKELRLSKSDWQCPTLHRKLREIPEESRPLIHYLPTPFSKEPNKANQWPRMPWFIEIGDAHGQGNLLVRQNGTIEPASK